jgi:putative ABC transport system substrate-binding protein
MERQRSADGWQEETTMWCRALGCIVTLTLSLLAVPLAAEAQQSGTAPRIGMLLPFGTSSPVPPPRLVAFQQGLRELGYVEGQNIAVEYRWAEGKLDRLPALAAELVRLKVAVIVTWGEAAIRAVKEATDTTPIVVALANDLVAAGHAASLARPGGNITGMIDTWPGLSAKRLELLKEVMPKASRIAVLWNGANPTKALDFRETQVAARVLEVEIQSLEVRSPNEFESAFEAATREGAGALVVLQDALITGHAKRIVDLAAKSHLPAMYGLREFVEAGGLMAYGVNVPDRFRRAATYVDKILQGAKPGDLPVEQAMRLELVINLKTAEALGLTLPPSVLFQADEVMR